MKQTTTYTGVVTKYRTVCDLDGVVTLSVTVRNTIDQQPPVRFAHLAGRKIRVTLTVEDGAEAIADSITDRYSNALSALAKDGETEHG